MIHRLFRAPDGTIRLVVQGLVRCRIEEYVQLEPYLKGRITVIPETVEEGPEIEALARNAREQFGRIADLVPSIPRELVASILELVDPLQRRPGIVGDRFGVRKTPPSGWHPGARGGSPRNWAKNPK